MPSVIGSHVQEFQNKTHWSHLTPCKLSMASVRNCDANSHNNERKDFNVVGCVRTFDRQLEWISHTYQK